ncbi:patatin-like phospholipase [Nitzschia inconspicua]|uniref:Patatin-like phospholipase n=1 Tax=Nitzschia inconspicua TaxID=303405 RepID=A0A9K3PSX0_9STRA|nr:patatin-like phospholipase [Nitzschia inconspicua]
MAPTISYESIMKRMWIVLFALCLYRSAEGFQRQAHVLQRSVASKFSRNTKNVLRTNVAPIPNSARKRKSIFLATAGTSDSSTPNTRIRKRDRFLAWYNNHAISQSRRPFATKKKADKEDTKEEIRYITSVEELDMYWDANEDLKNPKAVLSKLEVHGDTQIIGSPNHTDFVHPVLKVLYDKRRRLQQQPKDNAKTYPADDSAEETTGKIALVVEGGGMRGCVTAGMVAAVDYLGLRDCFDVVYGSSAGSVIGAYFITGQLPWFGPELYYDRLPTAGKHFIDTSRLLRMLGLGLLNPKLLKDVVTRPNAGKPVLNLDYLLKDTLQNTKRLDWKTFEEQQGKMPLKIMASALKGEKPIVLDYEHGHFSSLEEMAQCMHASCLLPGITGAVMNLRTNDEATDKPKFVLRNNLNDDDYEPLADSMIYAPIAYDVARQDGATHMVVLRSKPDGGDVIGKGGSIGELLTFSRFFKRKNKLPRIFRHMWQQRHKRWYAHSVLELNEAAQPDNTSDLPPTLTVALSPEYSEIARLESRRAAIFEGVRSGFARAYDALVEDPTERGRGKEVAKMYFPDEILDYSPTEIGVSSSSAFETFLEQSGLWPSAWTGLTEPPIKHPSTRPLPETESAPVP